MGDPAYPPPVAWMESGAPDENRVDSPGDVEVTPHGSSVRHMDRLLGGLLLAASPRVDWARLLRRPFGFDVLACTRCQGRMRLISAITEPAVVRRILEHLGISGTAPPVPRCRDPAGDAGAACTSAAPVATTARTSPGSDRT